ncbi:MAG: hypothetical protein U5K31_00030 [Balneolaceae bacterium]|nr:hypothetical protein [Balneolaceae bacterium]
MSTLYSHLDSVYKKGLDLLNELRSEQPDLDLVERLYRERAEEIAVLEQSFKFPPDLDDKETYEVTSLFEQLETLEKHLNKKLHMLRQSRMDALKEAGRHGKARDRYLANRDAVSADRSRIIDLKTHG